MSRQRAADSDGGHAFVRQPNPASPNVPSPSLVPLLTRAADNVLLRLSSRLVCPSVDELVLRTRSRRGAWGLQRHCARSRPAFYIVPVVHSARAELHIRHVAVPCTRRARRAKRHYRPQGGSGVGGYAVHVCGYRDALGRRKVVAPGAMGAEGRGGDGGFG
jgi:hypothetical protein